RNLPAVAVRSSLRIRPRLFFIAVAPSVVTPRSSKRRLVRELEHGDADHTVAHWPRHARRARSEARTRQGSEVLRLISDFQDRERTAAAFGELKELEVVVLCRLREQEGAPRGTRPLRSRWQSCLEQHLAY